MEQRPIILGVPDRLEPHVLATAADLSGALGTRLLCVHVNAAGYLIEELPDGTIRSAPLDPESGEEAIARFPEELLLQLHAQLDGTGLDWQVHATAGGPAQQLAWLAVRHDAVLIVLGVRQRSLASIIHELLNGSVAVQLAHRHHHPVLLVPARPAESAEQDQRP
ncbi:universal stress protein [Glutamicibacter sp. ZJUTW]|uniref:universal stress protein n=1 Tax=Glutamicibacter sp. ZJUTW TaxID=1155384 RepID=UPI0011F27D17|nr:universal stress protein [Glutamicibacter sp. ZJUTW]QEP06839.1 universal stress protein [Glutamicibacter sp. ZJUTW]